MRAFLFFVANLALTFLPAQELNHFEEIRAWQEQLNEEFADSATSPLTDEDRENFEGLDFFSIDSNYRVKAKFIRTKGEKPFRMPTSTDRKPVYEKYGEAHFTLNGKKHVLNIYQSHDLRKIPEYEKQLFLPFNDHTNGFETYGGGRYLDLEIPESNTLIIDFNKAYNPYCAYNYKYSCPIPPEENKLSTEIKAGVKAFDEP